MDGSSHGLDGSSRRAAFWIGGRRCEIDAPEFADAIASAHARHERPRCLCRPDGVEMYVARLGEGFIVKRMPNMGSQHTPDCRSYEPPAALSGLREVLGSAIQEDPASGLTTLKLGFAMEKIGGRFTVPPSHGTANSAATDGTKLSLRGLLHYLWDQAELTRWQPSFAGKRSWATVRKHLLQAAENMIARGGSLSARVYIPEVFSIEQRDAINARRIAHWTRAMAEPGKPQRFMLLIGEIKEIVPARYGYKAIVKHLPDQAFTLDEQLYRRLRRRFERELSLWAATEHVHLVTIATFAVNDGGVPRIAQLSLVPMTDQWLPIEDSFELQLIERLLRESRSFVKGLRYNMSANRSLASAILTDVDDSAAPLYIAQHRDDAEPLGASSAAPMKEQRAWTWPARQRPMPLLPRCRRHVG